MFELKKNIQANALRQVDKDCLSFEGREMLVFDHSYSSLSCLHLHSSQNTSNAANAKPNPETSDEETRAVKMHAAIKSNVKVAF